MASPFTPSSGATAPPPAAPMAAFAGDGADRSLGRRPGLPNGRAVIGGFLVMVAAVATFAAITSAGRGPGQHYVVAQGPLAAGERLEPQDLRLVTGELPPDVADRAFGSFDALDGAILLAPVGADELVTRSAVRLPGDDRRDGLPSHEVAFALPRAQAMAGGLQEGDLVDVIATFGTGADAYTTVVARRVRVLGVQASDGAVGADDAITITIALDTEQQVLETTHAVGVARITVSLATRADADDVAPGPYRPAEPPGRGAGSSGGSTTGTGVR